nr:NADH:ubiquinone oxidoreductase [Desulfuromonadales bacterium]NIR33492.1 NADH:ubiquinone oxidoreductase [Desulfuromonadales bacterium]NIS43090.1 NADH:ubiquinone oxidoreductase [Desulfuromonadales bacterium]
RMQENVCLLLEHHQPCLGPVSRAGCNACCPTFGVICEGCRGMAEEANRTEEYRLLLELGLSESEIESRMMRFTGSDHENR